jgi:DHA1 family bicyclomycin/chloramphenicol resistance-like MFS transporter
LDESVKRDQVQTLSPRQLLANYRRALSNPSYRGYALISVLNFGCLFAYIAASPLLLINTLGASPRLYGYLFAFTSFGFMLGGAVNGRLNMRGVSAGRLLGTGLAMTTSMTLLLLVFSLTGAATLATVTPLLFLTTVASALITPNATIGALHPLPEIAGTASSIIGCVQWLLGAAAGGLAGFMFDGHSPRGLGEVMSAFALASLLVYLGFVRPYERRAHDAAALQESAAAGTIEQP